MLKSKLTLIIDGNWLFMSRLSAISSKYSSNEEICKNLKILLAKSIDIVLRKITLIDNIIFVVDKGSWRTQVNIPNWLENYKISTNQNVEYKGTREKRDDIDWESYFKAYDEFISVLAQYGITVSKETNIEGDDWCWWWSTYLNSQNTNCLIWTKDNDLKQLVNMNKNKCFTAWWNIDSGLFINNFEEQELDFLFNSSFNENEMIWNSLIKSIKTVTKINPKSVIIDKIFKGDLSDNIFPIILRTSKSKSDKKFKISTKDIDYSLNIDDDNKIREFIHNLLNSKNYVNRIYGNKTENDIFEHFEFNKKLIVLEKDNYPNEIYDILNKYTEYNISTNIKDVESYFMAKSNDLMNTLNFI